VVITRQCGSAQIAWVTFGEHGRVSSGERRRASPGGYDEQHKYKLYSEPKWWRHPVVIPDDLNGTAQVNAQAVRLPVFHEEAPELIEQYVKAFEKVWGQRKTARLGA